MIDLSIFDYDHLSIFNDNSEIQSYRLYYDDIYVQIVYSNYTNAYTYSLCQNNLVIFDFSLKTEKEICDIVHKYIPFKKQISLF